MKPEDVMKALEHCADYKSAEVSCIGCPIYGRCFDEPNLLEISALDLLREKDALIAKHEAYIDTLNDDKEYLVTQIADLQQTVLKKDAEIERLKVRLNGLWEANDLLWDGGRKVCHEVIAAYTEMAKRRLPIISPSVFDSLAKDVLEGKK